MLEVRLAESILSSLSEAAAAAARAGTSHPRRSIHLASAAAASTLLSRPEESVFVLALSPSAAAAGDAPWRC